MMDDSRTVFPNGIRALVVDNDARFLRSASLMLSLLNFKVITCEGPALAVRLLSERLKDADVVFIDALRAATCGFDFRGIAEQHLCIPVIYFFSSDYKVARDVAEALRRTVWAATYVVKKPLDADDLCRLWRIIQWSKFLLQRGQKTWPWTEWHRGNRALLPATVQALLPSSSTFEDQGEDDDDDDGREQFRVVREGRGRRRELGDSPGGSSSGRGRGGVTGGQPTRRLAEQMNVIPEGQESDDDDTSMDTVFSVGQKRSSGAVHQQPAQKNRRGVQAMGVQNQQLGRSLFMQPVPPMLNMPRNYPMISADAAGPSSSNVAAFAGGSNTSAPALLPLPAVYSAQAPAPGLPPPVYQQHQPPVATARAAGRGRLRKLGDSHDGGGSSSRGRSGVAGSLEIGGQPTRRLAEQMNMTEGQESGDDDDVVPIYQQQNRQGVQAMGVQDQQHGRSSLFMQPVSQMLNMPRNNPMISAGAAGLNSSTATAFAGANNISAPTLLPAYQAPARARATSPASRVVYSAQAPVPGLPPPVVYQQQQPVALNDIGNMVAPPAAAPVPGLPPPVVYQQQQPVALNDIGSMVASPPAAAVPTMGDASGHQPPQFTLNQQQQEEEDMQGSWMGLRGETGPIMLSFQQPPAADTFAPMAAGGGTTFGASPNGATDAGAYGDAAVAHLQSQNVGAQPEPADSFHDVLRAMMMEMNMNDTFRRSYYANCSAEALVFPATDELGAIPMQAALGSGKSSNYNAGSFMVTDVNGGNGASSSSMAPQDPAVPTGNQVELGAQDIYGSLVGSSSQGPSAVFNGDGGGMAAMFPSDQYAENTMFSLDALWNFGNRVAMHPETQQVAAADGANDTHATAIMPNGGENGGLGPIRNMEAAADDGHDMVQEYLGDNADDGSLLPQDDVNNGA